MQLVNHSLPHAQTLECVNVDYTAVSRTGRSLARDVLLEFENIYTSIREVKKDGASEKGSLLPPTFTVW